MLANSAPKSYLPPVIFETFNDLLDKVDVLIKKNSQRLDKSCDGKNSLYSQTLEKIFGDIIINNIFLYCTLYLLHSKEDPRNDFENHSVSFHFLKFLSAGQFCFKILLAPRHF